MIGEREKERRREGEKEMIVDGKDEYGEPAAFPINSNSSSVISSSLRGSVVNLAIVDFAKPGEGIGR